jgi:hypothetical protein
VVEAIKQVGIHRPTARILICAPSNTAADVLLQRLSTSLTKQELLRFNSYQRDVEPGTVAYEYGCYDAAVGVFAYKYVVCTCAMAGKLFNYGVPRGTVVGVCVWSFGRTFGSVSIVFGVFDSLLC